MTAFASSLSSALSWRSAIGAGRRTSPARSPFSGRGQTSTRTDRRSRALDRRGRAPRGRGRGQGLKAVVADGATAESFADVRNLNGLNAATPYWWTMYTAARVLSGSSPGEPLKDLVARVSPTPLLLISTGGSLPAELDMNRLYAEAAREPVELWELSEVDHTAAIRERPDEYERRVVGLFDAALLDRGNR